MLNLRMGKLHNSYIIETNNYQNVKQEIKKFAISLGFDENNVNAETHPDIKFIETGGTHLKIDIVREQILETVAYSPKLADKKIYVVFDMVNVDSQTEISLLKTFEEPPEFDIFILVTSNASKIGAPLKSRALVLYDNSEQNINDVINNIYFGNVIKILEDRNYPDVVFNMEFANNFNDEVKFTLFIKIIRIILRDALVYKESLNRNLINLKGKENDIVDLATTLTVDDFKELLYKLNFLSAIKDKQINRKIAIFNYITK